MHKKYSIGEQKGPTNTIGGTLLARQKMVRKARRYLHA
jgi:hypothetical protein